MDFTVIKVKQKTCGMFNMLPTDDDRLPIPVSPVLLLTVW